MHLAAWPLSKPSKKCDQPLVALWKLKQQCNNWAREGDCTASRCRAPRHRPADRVWTSIVLPQRDTTTQPPPLSNRTSNGINCRQDRQLTSQSFFAHIFRAHQRYDSLRLTHVGLFTNGQYKQIKVIVAQADFNQRTGTLRDYVQGKPDKYT